LPFTTAALVGVVGYGLPVSLARPALVRLVASATHDAFLALDPVLGEVSPPLLLALDPHATNAAPAIAHAPARVKYLRRDDLTVCMDISLRIRSFTPVDARPVPRTDNETVIQHPRPGAAVGVARPLPATGRYTPRTQDIGPVPATTPRARYHPPAPVRNWSLHPAQLAGHSGLLEFNVDSKRLVVKTLLATVL